MRGLLNLALSLNEAGRFDDALNVCAQFERETGDLTMAASSRAAVLLNTSAWGPAVEAAQASGENRSPFVEALALFELGNSEKALRRFVRGALLYPRAARSLVGLKPESRPTSREEGEDHNLGIALLRQFHEFLRTQSRASKAFFRSVMKDARFERLLREVQEVTLRWLTERSATDRRTFERMTLMQSDVFAEVEAGKMLDLVRAPPRGALLH
jgi:tetratricopeptide (TPR) repeat protein